MEGTNRLSNSPHIPLSDLHQQNNNNNSNPHMPPPPSHFDTPSSHDDFLHQMLSSSSWSDLSPKPFWDDPTTTSFHFDDHSSLASKFRNHQITPSPDVKPNVNANGNGNGNGNLPSPLMHHLLIHRGLPPDSLLLPPIPLNDVVLDATNPGADNSVQPLYNGFTAGSLQIPSHTPQFTNPQGGGNGPAPASGAAATAAGQPRQRVRARRGQATDPHSIAERLRRERIAERMKALQELVPNANKTDKASMLDEIIDYVKFLQLQVKVLSMSRLGGAAAVAPLVADMASEANTAGCGDGVNGNQTPPSTSNDSITMTEQQVAKLMEEDMGSAMQYLQGKGLCLMPISLATAISTATCHSRGPLLHKGPTSPCMSALTVQSVTAGNGVGDGSVKEVVSVSKA